MYKIIYAKIIQSYNSYYTVSTISSMELSITTKLYITEKYDAPKISGKSKDWGIYQISDWASTINLVPVFGKE